MTKNFFKVFTAVAACTMLCISCSNGQNKTEAQTIQVSDFDSKMNASHNKLVVDVRTPEEFNSGHLQNAVNIDINSGDFMEKVQALDTTKTVFVYCLGGGRSGHAKEMMKTMGFDTIYDMKGGIAAWNASGKPLAGAEKTESSGMTKAEFLKLTNHGDTLVMVEFSAPWCAPCKKIKAYLPNVKKKFGTSVLFLDIDYDQNKQLAAELNITGIPYIILMKNGKYALNIEGFVDEQMLTDDIVKFK